MTATQDKKVVHGGTELPDAITGQYDDESVVAELRRIDFTGTIWFAAAIIASSVALTGLLASRWRPTDMPLGAEVVWWVGAALAFIGTACFGWAGCPVLAWRLPVAERQKSICIRAGIGLYLVGSVAAGISVLAVPAG